MGESQERDYERVLMGHIRLIDQCVEEGNVLGFERNARTVVRLLKQIGKVFYGESFKPQKPEKKLSDLERIFDNEESSISDREEALNRAIHDYSTESEPYKRLRRNTLINQNNRWIENYDLKSRRILGPVMEDRLSLLEKSLKAHLHGGDVERFEQVANLIVVTAKNSIERINSHYGEALKRPEETNPEYSGVLKERVEQKEIYQKWIELHTPGSKNYDLLREFATQNRYKKGLPPE